MPHYYFHVSNGTGETRDEEGVELPDIEAVRARAFAGIRSILREEVSRGLLDFCGLIQVVDGDGQIVMVVPFDTAVEVRRSGHQR